MREVHQIACTRPLQFLLAVVGEELIIKTLLRSLLLLNARCTTLLVRLKFVMV